MPTYDVSCRTCGGEREIFLTFADYDRARSEPLTAYCPVCGASTRHAIVIHTVAGVEWRTDGAYSYDNADQWTRYQRDHFAESGDRSEKKLAMRKRRRPGTDYIE